MSRRAPESRQKRAEKMAERLMQAMEGEKEPPPVLRRCFRGSRGARGVVGADTDQRRNHLLGIFYYETAEARERRAEKAIGEAVRKQGARERGT